MFGGGKRSKTGSTSAAAKTKSKNNDLANMMGLGVPMEPDDEDESSLLAELAALEGKPQPTRKAKPKKVLVSMDEIDKMAAAGMADVNDDDINEDDDFDEHDLLAELNELASDGEEDNESTHEPENQPQVTKPNTEIQNVLLARKEMYQSAIATAKTEGASSKVRRFERGLKEIDNLIKKVSKSGTISEDEIPPPVATKTSKPINPDTQTLPPPQTGRPIVQTPVERFTAPTETPVIPEPKPALQLKAETTDHTEIDSGKLSLLLERQKQFKVLALHLKQHGDIDGARQNLVTAKQFDMVIAALKEGKEIDLSDMPELPSKTTQPKPAPRPPPDATGPAPVKQSTEQSSAPSGPPPAPTSVMEALQQRLEKYQDASNKAKEEGNSSKARRMGRIVKQYQDAIKNYKLKKPVDFNELPCPPGFGPIPGVNAAADQPADPQEMAQMLVNAPTDEPTASSNASQPPRPSAVTQEASQPAPVASRNEKEYQFLVTRQREFKKAALEAKQVGNVAEAKELLRQAKGLEPMIEAASNGIRVDVTTVPTLKKKDGSLGKQATASPGLKENVQLTGNMNEDYIFVETALRKQIEAAEKNTEHYNLLGNLDASKNFAALLKGSQKDLDTLLQYKANKAPVPKCYYVRKTFPVTKSNPHLSDSELEITVVRCINVPLQQGYQPKDMYTYVTYEIAYPQEKPQTGNTATKKETINPEFNESFKVIIDRKQSSFKRFCRRGAVNLKLFYVRGFLKSDKGIGQANIKINDFSNKCEIHQCVDILDLEKGRKAVGGKIEVRLKIREPFENKDTDIINEKWLILDSHLRGLDMKTPSQPAQKAQASYESLEVLKSEKSLYERQVTAYKNKGRQPPTDLMQKIQHHDQKMLSIQSRLKQDGRQGVVDYLKNLITGVEIEKTNAINATQKSDNQSAKNSLVRKKLLEKEIGVLKQRLGH